MPSIEIDADVWAELARRAEDLRRRNGPLQDTSPNAILRQLLLAENEQEHAVTEVSVRYDPWGLPQFPIGTSAALQQILEVAYLARNTRRSRSEATHEVARRHRVAPQTVLDKYCRQLGLTASSFDRLVSQPDAKELRSLLLKRFPGDAETIDRLLDLKSP